MFERDKRLYKIAEHYGLDAQKMMLVEECAELIQAALKTNRYPDDPNAWNNFREELTDVAIMLEQIIYLTGFRYDMIADGNAKLDRTLERMKESSGWTETDEHIQECKERVEKAFKGLVRDIDGEWKQASRALCEYSAIKAFESAVEELSGTTSHKPF